ncbi:unnamed protein product [Spodoptera exigua]|nr:unnamed protein product [Spodoptera exigua]
MKVNVVRKPGLKFLKRSLKTSTRRKQSWWFTLKPSPCEKRPLLSHGHLKGDFVIMGRRVRLVTFSDGSNGFPRNEGFFQDCRLVRRKRCPEVVQRAQKVAYMARAQCQQM